MWAWLKVKKKAFALRTGFGLLANAILYLLHYQQGLNWVTDGMSVQCFAGTVCLAALFSSCPPSHTFASPISSLETKQKSCTEDEQGDKTCHPQLVFRLYPWFPSRLITIICPDQQTNILFWQSFECLITEPELEDDLTLAPSVSSEGLIPSEGHSFPWLFKEPGVTRLCTDDLQSRKKRQKGRLEGTSGGV